MTNSASHIDSAFVQRVVEHCLGDSAAPAQDKTEILFGNAFTYWDGKDGFRTRSGQPLNISRGDDGLFFTDDDKSSLRRAAKVVNEMAGLGFQSPVRVDMHDARRYGVSKRTALSQPVIVYNRKKAAKNLILWPLPGYHTIGETKFVHKTPIDKLAFDDKRDVVRWRGNLTGRPNKTLAPHATRRRSALSIMQSIKTANSEDKLNDLYQELMGITRYNIVSRYFDYKEFNIAFTLPDIHEQAQSSRLLAPFCSHRRPVKWFFRAKYILSMSGNDTGSNFPMSVNSNSVVLRESDDWELFYTGEFRAWEHYIPLTRGATDLEEKLAWARENPVRCKEMSKASQNVCALFASRANRQAYLSEILNNMPRHI